MASSQHPNSPVFHRLFQPAREAFAASETRYLCHRIPDEDYLSAGVLRCLSSSRTGRDFLQNHGDFGALDISVITFSNHQTTPLKNPSSHSPLCAFPTSFLPFPLTASHLPYAIHPPRPTHTHRKQSKKRSPPHSTHSFPPHRNRSTTLNATHMHMNVSLIPCQPKDK